MQDGIALAEYAVKLAEGKGFAYAEAYFEVSAGTSYALEQGVLNGSSYFSKAGMRIRLLRQGKLYTFSTNLLEKKAIARAIEDFKGFKGTNTQLSSEKPQRAKVKVAEKKKFDEQRILKDLIGIDKAIKENKHIKFRSMYAGMGRTASFFTNSEGTRIETSAPAIASMFSINVTSGSESRQRVTQFGGIGGYEQISVSKIEKQILDESKAMLKVMKNGITLGKDELRKINNVIISPEIAGIAVHESIGHPLEADRVFMREAAQAGTSYVNKDNLGLQIGSKQVTIIDDPLIENAYGFYRYDDEGVKARRKEIVVKGRQTELLKNREYAHLLGEKSNGSARSDSYGNEPIVRMSNTYLKKGSADFEELVQEARNGIYIRNFTEWNIDDTRSFSRYQGNEAYLIKNGSVEKPIKNYVLETKTFDFWKAVDLVGKDFELFLGNCGKGEPMQGVPVTMGGPHALLRFEM